MEHSTSTFPFSVHAAIYVTEDGFNVCYEGGHAVYFPTRHEAIAYLVKMLEGDIPVD